MDKPMPTVFSASTEITIFFTGWTTSTVTQYILTLIFIFILAILNRFLGALKSQLERSWSQETVPSDLLLAPVNQQSGRKAKLGSPPDYLHVPGEDDPDDVSLSHDIEARSTSIGLLERATPRKSVSQKCLLSWKASGTWSFRKDGTCALLECARAVTGYFIMIAVMTCNIGVFGAVVFGVLVGELFLGRFSQGMSG